MEYVHISHPWDPVYNKESLILILGSFPSVKSRENGFYYGHPQNLFWKLLPQLLSLDILLDTINSKRKFLLDNKIAVWDTIAECDIKASSDSSIKNARANDIKSLIEKSGIKTIFTTGKKSTDLYEKYCFSQTGIHAIYLPSTSPANRAQQSRPEFMEKWLLVPKALNK